MKNEKKKKDSWKDNDEEVEVVEKGPCQDCLSSDWEYAHRNEKGEFVRCNKCHVWDANVGAMKPRVLH